MKKILLLTLVFAVGRAEASATRAVVADTIQNTTGGSAFSVPSTGANLLTDSSSLPAANVTGQVSVAHGGTGLASGTSGGILGFTASGTVASSAALTANALVIGGGAGATPTALGSTGTATTLLHGNASGAPTFGAVALGTDVSGQLPVANGGTGLATLTSGAVVVGAGSSNPTFVSPGSNGNVLTVSGGVWTSAAPSATSPSLNGGSGSAQAVTAGGGVVLSSITYENFAWVAGSGGAVTVTKTPSITVGTADGQILRVIGTSNTNTVTLQDQASLASSGLSLNGNWVGAKDSVLMLHWDATQSLWVEDSRR